jgi:rSAM/selenodomain-associated transferase 1
MPCAYLIFARNPALGRVKTRLAATLGDEKTLALYEAMLEDTVQNVLMRLRTNTAQVAAAYIFAYPPDSTAELALWLNKRNLTHKNLHILPQEGATLGEQMLRAFRYAESHSALPAIIMGADSPTLPQPVFAEAEEALLAGQAVIGRADDGGFYMMGLGEVRDSFFFGDDYSNATVYERSVEALRGHFSLVHELPTWVDIDDSASLRALLDYHAKDLPQTAFKTLLQTEGAV